jgi:hypothetical protein
MPILVACPGCSTKLNAPDAAAGKRVKCPKPQCGMIVPVPAPAAADPGFEVVEDEPAPPPPKPKTKPLIAVVEADDDDRPRSRRRRDENEEDDRPRKRRGDDYDDYGDDRPRRKKRKKTGMGTGAIVGIVLGGIVLLAGLGYGIYALVGGGSKAPVPAGWVEYKSDSDKFKAYFPSKPGEPMTMPAGLGGMTGVESVTMHMVQSKGDSPLTAGVIVLKFKSGMSSAERDKAMEPFRGNFSKGSDALISSPRSVRWGGKKAEEITIGDKGTSANGKKGGGVIRYFTTDTHAYIGIFGTENAGAPKQEDVDGFFDNFEFFS